jgi:hypothetical protein
MKKTKAWGVTAVDMDGKTRYFATEFTLEDGKVTEAMNITDPHPYRALAYAHLPDTIIKFYRALLSKEASPRNTPAARAAINTPAMPRPAAVVTPIKGKKS